MGCKNAKKPATFCSHTSAKKLQQQRSLTERKAIVIAQVPAVVEPGTFKCRMTNFASTSKGPGGPGDRPGSSARAKSATTPANRMQAAPAAGIGTQCFGPQPQHYRP